jgi:hypothetical protein
MRKGLLRIGILTVGLAATASCGSGGDEPAPPAPTASGPTLPTAGTQQSPITWNVTAGGDAEQNAVQTAGQAYWAMTIRLYEKPDPGDAEIGATSVDPQRAKVVTLLGTIRKAGESQRGPVVAKVTNVSVKGDAASVSMCVDLSAARTYSKEGKELGRGSAAVYVLVLKQAGAGWKVAQQSSLPNTCTAT